MKKISRPQKADYVCSHCGLPAWNWDGEDEYFCPNGCASDSIPATTILRPWDDALDAGKQPPMTCLRSNGTPRARFVTREQAEAFSEDPANPAYHGDLAHHCPKCGFYHLSRPEWLHPQITTSDAQFLEDCGVEAPGRMNEYFRCTVCGTVMREGIEFFILNDGDIRCSEKCAQAR